MPPLHRVLADHDLGLLRLIAELWGLELAAGSQREAADELARRMLSPELAEEIIAALPPEAHAAFEQLARDGRQLLASFTRRYGELRAMGATRRDRERPWANAPSASEVLWYRGLIGRAFFDAGRGPEEFVFIPDDLRALAYVATAGAAEAAALPAPPGQPLGAPDPTVPAASGLNASGINASGLNASGDDAITLLAYLQVVAVRLETPPGAAAGAVPAAHRAALARFLRQPAALDFYLHLLRQLALAEDPGGKEPVRLAPERVQPFLQAGGPERARQLAEAWRDSREWNDLLAVPGLVFEGQSWRNDPGAARQAILKLLAGVPPGVWWSLESFVAAVKERQPDFQRPAGDYDSWYIRDAASGAYLRGFSNWERVDGALVRWLIEQPLAWLGAVERTTVAETTAAPEPFPVAFTPGRGVPISAPVVGATTPDPARLDRPSQARVVNAPRAFRLTPYGAALLGRDGWPEASEPARLEVAAHGLVRALAGESGAPASGYDRFQLARIGDWLPPVVASPEEESAPDTEAGAPGRTQRSAPTNAVVYPYRLTPTSLARAARKGIPPGRILAFLERAAAGQPSLPALAAALRRWEKNGAEISLRETAVLRLASAELLETLRQTPGVAERLGESLGPTAVEVRRADLEGLQAALWALGILTDATA